MKKLRVDHPEDILALPKEWQHEALRVLQAIRDEPDGPRFYRHRILEYQPLMRGDLSGLHAVTFGAASSIGAAYYFSFRVVYRVNDDEVEVLAIGSRTGSEVFKLARDRLYPDTIYAKERFDNKGADRLRHPR